MKKRDSLKQLFKDHQGKLSDKWSLYLDEWDRLFDPYCLRQINLLEIGIQNGGSLEVWGKYFQNALKIIGCDIDEKCGQLRFVDPRISVIVGDANSDITESVILKRSPLFDIIIDDGSHISSNVVRSFARYFPHLVDGGIYVVEDLHSSYWDNFGGGLHNPLSAMSFFKRLTDILNFEHWRNSQTRNNSLAKFSAEYGVNFEDLTLSRIHSIEFINSLCIIVASSPDENILGERVVSGNVEEVTFEANKLNGSTIKDIAVETHDDSSLDVFELIAGADSLKHTISEQEQLIGSISGQVSEKDRSIQVLANQVVEKDQAVQSLAAQLTLKEQSLRKLAARMTKKEHSLKSLKSSLAQQEQKAQSLESAVVQKNQAIQSLESAVAQKEQMLQVVAAHKDRMESSVQLLGARLGEVYGSRGWRLVQFLWRIRLFFIPTGSKREKAARSIYHALRSGRIVNQPVRSAPDAIPQEVKIPEASQLSSPAKEVDTDYAKYDEVYDAMLQSTKPSLDKEFVPAAESVLLPGVPPVKLIAFYLPQFHPIPENDLWWGKGFTEWTNVTKSIPQFVGHYQPHLPGDLGFYDLRVPDVLRQQVQLAKKYGIFGFCFHYYWFNGKRLLEKPLQQFMGDSQIDFPFCVCWANENWTRRWDGAENDVLLAQTHTQESDKEFIKDLEPVLSHPNYIRINGRPVIIVYRTSLMKNPARAAATWREYCIGKGLGDPYLVAAQTFGFCDPRPIGFDAAVEFPPHNISVPEITRGIQILNPAYAGKIYNYIDLADRAIPYNHGAQYKLFKTVAPAWDNAPRTPGKGHTYAFSTPAVYGHWLTQVSRSTINTNDPESRLVFINAWNEWGEGAYLEPDRKYGYAYLQATADALRAVSEEGKTGRVEFASTFYSPGNILKRHDTAVLLHIYYPELWQKIEHFLDNLQLDFDLFVSIPSDVEFDAARSFQKYPHTYVYRCENRGRDIAPFLRTLPLVQEMGYQSALKLHTKKTVHREDGLQWLDDILEKLLGSKGNILAARSAFLQKDVGLVVPAGHLLPSIYYWGAAEEAVANQTNVGNLARMAGLSNYPNDFYFAAGSMYWFRPSALKLVTSLNLAESNFEPEQAKKDGTLAHALERFIGLSVTGSGYRIVEVDRNGTLNGVSPAEINLRTNYPFAQATLNGRPFVDRS